VYRIGWPTVKNLAEDDDFFSRVAHFSASTDVQQLSTTP